MFGVNLEELKHEDPTPEIVEGRVLQLDGDFICYHVTCHKDVPFSEMRRVAIKQIAKLQMYAGASRVVVHMTPSESDKGKRSQIAIQKPYQATRAGKEKPEHLERMRKELAKTFDAKLWLDREADDGMCIANAEAIKRGERHLSVICSRDKDLRMCQGLHLDWDKLELFDVDGFGEIYLDDSKSSKKVIGTGRKFFWAQMLMGDTADNIQGLPKITPEMWEKYTGGTCKKPKSCGAVATYELLKDVQDDLTAFDVVVDLYMSYGAYVGFTDYIDGKPVDWFDVFNSEAKLLWMRDTHTEDSVIHYLRTLGAYNG